MEEEERAELVDLEQSADEDLRAFKNCSLFGLIVIVMFVLEVLT